MQDNPHKIYSKAFVDKNWSDMKDRLDANLPTPATQGEVHSRSTLLLVLSFLLFLSLLSTAFYAYKYKSFIPSAELIKENVIYKTIYINEDDNVEAELDQSSEVKAISSSILRESNTKAQTILSSTELTKKPSYTDPNESMEAAIDKKAYLEQLDQLDSKTSLLSQAQTKEFSYAKEQAQSEAEDQKRAIQYNVGVQTLITTDLDYTGVGLNSGLVIPLGKKIGINTGLAVNQLTRENYFVEPFQRNLDQAPNPQSSDVETYYNGLKSMKQVYVPVGMMYAFSDNLALNSGVKFRYTFDKDIDELLPAPPRGRRAPLPTTESMFNNTKVGLTAGFLYRFNSHFSILVDSEWGLSPFINAQQFGNPNNARYDLNMVNLTTNYTF